MNDDKKKSTSDSSDSAKKREIGEGMHSLDSTQAPLKTSDGLPDYEAMTGGREPSARKRAADEKSKQGSSEE
jgi:hypothetical protein